MVKSFGRNQAFFFHGFCIDSFLPTATIVIGKLFQNVHAINFAEVACKKLSSLDSNRWKLSFTVIILKATSLILKFLLNMLRLKIAIQIKSPVSIVFGTNSISFFLRGCNSLFLLKFLLACWLSIVVEVMGWHPVTFSVSHSREDSLCLRWASESLSW